MSVNLQGTLPSPLDGGFPQFRPPTGKVDKYETDDVAIQVEGSPFAYDPRDPWAKNGALDYLRNAGHPGDWYGVATNKAGQPFYNGFGNYVSQTGWSKPGTQGWRQSDYVNGDYFPTVSLTNDQAKGMEKGDAVWLFNERTGQGTLAIYADNRGDNPGIEISSAAAINLGVQFGGNKTTPDGRPRDPTATTSNDHIIMYTYPGSRVRGWFPGK